RRSVRPGRASDTQGVRADAQIPPVPIACLVPFCQMDTRTLPPNDGTYATAQQPVGPQATAAAWQVIIRSALEKRRSRIGSSPLLAEKPELVVRGLPVTGVGAPVHVQGFPSHERGRLQVKDRFDHLPDLAHPPQRMQPPAWPSRPPPT